MPGFPAKLGPFTGGINTYSDANSIADTEMQDCVNFELDFDGSLVGRPPVVATPGAVGFGALRVLMLGYGIFQTGNYLIASNANGTYYKLGSGSWVTIKAGLKCTSMVQYGDVVFLLATPDSTQASGSWTPTGGFTTVAGMPRGQSIIVYKDRGFICPGENASNNNSRLYFSKATDLTSWTDITVAGSLDVNPGDGQALVEIYVLGDFIICFKQHSTYVFGYTLAPSGASLRSISTTIGVQTKRCVVSFEGALYLYHEGDIYELAKYAFVQLNQKVPFTYDATSPGTFVDPVSLSLVGNRVLVRYYNRVYVFGLRTRTWTRWESVNYFGPFVQEPTNVVASVNPRFFSGSCVSSVTDIFQLNDGYDDVQAEQMNCSFSTKYEDMSHYIRVGRYFVTQDHKFKKLFWWGIGVNTPNTVTGTATPIVFNAKPTWGQIAQFTWAQIAANTWANPTGSLANISVVSPATSGGIVRRFIKFPKGLRFRLIFFTIDMDTNGTLSDGPIRAHEIVALVAAKETLVKQVS